VLEIHPQAGRLAVSSHAVRQLHLLHSFTPWTLDAQLNGSVAVIWFLWLCPGSHLFFVQGTSKSQTVCDKPLVLTSARFSRARAMRNQITATVSVEFGENRENVTTGKKRE